MFLLPKHTDLFVLHPGLLHWSVRSLYVPSLSSPSHKRSSSCGICAVSYFFNLFWYHWWNHWIVSVLAFKSYWNCSHSVMILHWQQVLVSEFCEILFYFAFHLEYITDSGNVGRLYGFKSHPVTTASFTLSHWSFRGFTSCVHLHAPCSKCCLCGTASSVAGLSPLLTFPVPVPRSDVRLAGLQLLQVTLFALSEY